jgi:hypothetical protein
MMLHAFAEALAAGGAAEEARPKRRLFGVTGSAEGLPECRGDGARVRGSLAAVLAGDLGFGGRFCGSWLLDVLDGSHSDERLALGECASL